LELILQFCTTLSSQQKEKKKKKEKDTMPEFASLLHLMLKYSYLAILKISSELIKLT